MLEKTPVEHSDGDLQTETKVLEAPKKSRSNLVMGARATIQLVFMAVVLFGAYQIMERMAASREEPGTRSFNRGAVTVETNEITRGDFRPTILVYGQIETAREIELRPFVAGEIISVNPNLSAGTRIEEGDLLVEIDRFNYEGAVLEAKANLAQVQGAIREIDARLALEKDQLTSSGEQLDLARADLERAQSLVQSGTLTTKQVDDRVLIVSQRAQSVSQRENNILINEAQREQQVANAERLEWKLNEAEKRLDDTVLRAPFSGIISNSNAEPGRAVTTNDVIASIYDDTALEVRFTLTNAQYGRMAADSDPLIGRSVEVIWTIGASDYKYNGKIDRIGATVTAERGGVEVVALVDPASHAVQLRPGAFVEIIVPDRLYADKVKVPETSIYDQSHIFLVEEGQLSRRDVVIEAFDGNQAIVGEKDGTDLITNGAQLLTTRLTQASDGVRVQAPGKGRPQGGRPEGGRPQGNGQGSGQGRPEGGRPEGGRPEGGRQEGGRPEGGGNRRNGAQNGENRPQNSGDNAGTAGAAGTGNAGNNNNNANNNNDRRQNPNRPRAVNRGLGG